MVGWSPIFDIFEEIFFLRSLSGLEKFVENVSQVINLMVSSVEPSNLTSILDPQALTLSNSPIS